MTSEDQPAASAPADTSLANRYGGQKRALSRKTKRNVTIAGLAAGIGLMAWISTSSAQDSVTFKDIGYTTVDATQAVVDFQVTREPGAAAKCAVKALDSKFAVVGWKVVDVRPAPKGAGGTTVERVVLTTESQAVSGIVDNCWLPD